MIDFRTALEFSLLRWLTDLDGHSKNFPAPEIEMLHANCGLCQLYIGDRPISYGRASTQFPICGDCPLDDDYALSIVKAWCCLEFQADDYLGIYHRLYELYLCYDAQYGW